MEKGARVPAAPFVVVVAAAVVSSGPVQAGPAVGERGRPIEVDVPTLIALSAVAWALVDVLHEIVGHAGAAVLLGVPVRAVSTTTAYLAWDQVQTVGDARTIDAAATVLNLVTGGLALLALRSRRVTNPASRYFLWIFATFSLTVVTVNLLAGGDWTEVIRGLEPRGLWRAGIVAVGMLVAVAGYILPLKLWMPDLHEDRRLQLKVTAIPVVVFIVVQTLSVAWSPFARQPWGSGQNALASVVAISFILGLWLALVNLVQRPRSTKPVESIQMTRSNIWLAVGLIVFLLFVTVLGPGLGPLEDDPRLT